MIVIATHINYSKSIAANLAQMKTIGMNLGRIIVVVAGSPPPAPPASTRDPAATYIYMPTNCFELTAVAGAVEILPHIHPDITHFLFIQDTSFPGPEFPRLSALFLQEAAAQNADVYYASADRKCNIAALSRRFIETHGHRYAITSDKSVAWQAEHNGELAFSTLALSSGMKVVDSPEDAVWGSKIFKYHDSVIYRCPVQFKSLDLVKLVASNESINPPWQERVMP